jgi:ornithine cyclodeaminase/alanine dehydrogenase-like protein (mu-crystallin family)
MASADLPPLRYLAGADVIAAMPSLEERLRLAELTMTALVADAELPPKTVVHPRPQHSIGHAMPAYLRGVDGRGSGDALGLKWVTAFFANADQGLPAIHALVLLNDPLTGVPLAILDGGPITAQRTAAVSGVAIGRFAPPVVGRAPRVTLIGAGIQGRSHLDVIGHLLPGCALTLASRHPGRAERLAMVARTTPGIAAVSVVGDARRAALGADVVVTAATMGPVRQVMSGDWLGPRSLVVAIDYATYVSAQVAREAAIFLVDDRSQFLANRDAGLFEAYPDPTMTLGEAILAGAQRPEGRVVVTHLGVGLADVIFATSILAKAEAAGLGLLLPR